MNISEIKKLLIVEINKATDKDLLTILLIDMIDENSKFKSHTSEFSETDLTYEKEFKSQVTQNHWQKILEDEKMLQAGLIDGDSWENVKQMIKEDYGI